MQLSPIIIFALVGVDVVGLIFAFIFLFKDAQLSRRYGKLFNRKSEDKVLEELFGESQDGEENKNKGKKTKFTFINDMLARTSYTIAPNQLILLWIVAIIVPPIIIILFAGNVVLGILSAVVGGAIPYFILKHGEKKWLLLFEDQLASALPIIAKSIKTGVTFQAAIEGIVESMPNPISSEFGHVQTSMRVGVSAVDALNEVSERMHNPDISYLASALDVHERAGGNLSEIIENIASTIRDRISLRRHIKSSTAQARMSAMVVAALPVLLFTAYSFISPDYMSVFYTEVRGWAALGLAIVLEITGVIILRKLYNIEVD